LTRYKKCDYCHQQSDQWQIIKTQNELFDGKDIHGYVAGGGYIRETAIKVRLCKICYDFFFEDQKDEPKLDYSKIPEIAEIFTRKKKMVL
jgi:hypothetical protein